MKKNVREEILGVFISQVSQFGLEATSLDKIAARLGMRRNHVGYYFPSRNSLIRGALESCIRVGQQITADGLQHAKGPEDIVVRWSLGAFDWIDAYPEHGAVLLLFYGLCHHDPEVRAQNTIILETGIERAAKALRLNSKRKLPRIETTLREIQNFNWGLLLRYLTTEHKISMKSLKETVRQNAVEKISPFFKTKTK